MSRHGPDFDDLVGSGLDPHERQRLQRVHDLLVAAGPPPEAPPALRAPTDDLAPRRRSRPLLVAIAAALGVVVFAAGVLVGGARDDGQAAAFTVSMEGVGAEADASASLAVFDLDDAGNWPMELSVEGLDAGGDGYELWLTKDDRPYALCGSFRVDDAGAARVPLNAPYELDDTAGWIVVARGSDEPLLTTS
jgi:hypothetical protein